MSCIQGTEKQYYLSPAERAGFSTLILAIVAVAATVFALHFTSYLPLSDKFAIPMLSIYAISAALSSIYLLSLILRRAAPKPPEIQIEIEDSAEENPMFIDPFLQSPENTLEALKSERDLVLRPEKLDLLKKAKERLGRAKQSTAQIDWQQFALMNNTSFIIGSRFGNGHQSYGCLTAYLNYVSHLQQEAPFFEFEGSQEIFKELGVTLNAAKTIMSNYPRCYDGAMDGQELQKTSRTILNLINQELMKKGFVYFPVGYCGRRGKSGSHALACKIGYNRQKSELTITFLNLGEGAQYHPELGMSATCMKSSYSYYPAVITLDLWNEIAPSFISHLIRFMSDLPLKKTGYSTRDIYDLLAVLQSPSIDYILENADQLSAKLQHVGDCPEKCARNIIIDFLLMEKRLSQNQVNTLFLNLHFASIIAALKGYENAPNEEHQALLINGCEEFANFLLRSKDHISEKDYLETAEMIALILQGAKSKEPEPSLFLPTHRIPVSTSFPPIKPPEKISLKNRDPGRESPVQPIFLPPFNPSTFTNDLQQLVKLAEREGAGKYPPMFYLKNTYVNTLPLPKWGCVDIWDEVPLEEIPEILNLFKKMTSSNEILRMSTLYAITDKLMRRMDTDGLLKGLAFPFVPKKMQQCVFFPEPSEEKRFQQIGHYFSQSLKAAERKYFPYPQDWQKVSSELQVLLELAGSVIGCKGGVCNLEILQKHYSWEDLVPGHSNRNPNFYERRVMRFFLKSGDFTNNDLLCVPKNFKKVYGDDLEGVDRQLLDELMLLLQNPKLQIGISIQWIQNHLNELNKQFVQSVVQFAFFSAGALTERLRETPEIVDELRSLVDQGLDYYGERYAYYEASLFLLHFGITLESYFAEFSDKPIDEGRLEIYQNRLEALQTKVHINGEREKEERYFVLILQIKHILESFSQKKTLEEFARLYEKIFTLGAINNGGYQHYYIPAIADRYIPINYQFYVQLTQFLEDQQEKKHEMLDYICNSILTALTGTPSSLGWHLEEGTVSSFSESCVIDFLEGVVFQRTTDYPLLRPRSHEAKWGKHKEFGIDPSTLWWTTHFKGCGESPIRISFNESTILAHLWGQKPFMIQNDGVYFGKTLARFDTKKIKKQLPIVEAFPFHHYYMSDSEQENAILSYIRGEDKPFMKITISPQDVTIYRVDEHENNLPYKLANLKELLPTHPLYAYTLNFAPSDEVHCFIHEATQEIEEIYFTKLKLSFKNNEGKLESVEFPGYFFLPQKIQALNKCSQNALILRSLAGQIKIILPIPKMEKKVLGFHAEKGAEATIDGSLKKKNYFAFDLESKDSPLKCATFSEKLFLIYFLKAGGDYERAISELKELHLFPFDETALEVLNLFFWLNDQTPLSLAFTQKIVLFLVDHLHLFLGYEKMDDLKQKIQFPLRWACGWYVNYLRATGDDQQNGIPITWRLSEDEEFRILLCLESEGIELPKILKVRMELLLSESRSAEVDFIPQEVALTPAAFQKVIPPRSMEASKLL